MNTSKQMRSFAELAAQFQTVRVSTSCWLRESKANAKGLAPISLRIIVNGARIERSTGIRVAAPVRDEQGRIVTPGGWDEKLSCIRGTSKLALIQNEQLELQKAHVTDLVNLMKATGRKVTAGSLRKQMLAPTIGKPVCFIELCQQQLEGVCSTDEIGSIKQKQGAITALIKWNGRGKDKKPQPLPLDDFGPDRAAQFYNWLLLERQVKAVTANTIISALTTLFAYAVKLNEADAAQNPFRLLKRKAVEETARVRLSREQLAALREAPLTDGPALARDIYLAQYYLHGSRVGAVLLLRWQDVRQGRVNFKAEKGGPQKSIEIADELQRILARYQPATPAPTALVFPALPAKFYDLAVQQRLMARQKAIGAVNRWLREAGAAVGIVEYLHTHTARHTLARHAAELAGLAVAQVMLGHTNQRQTEAYVGPLGGDVVEAAQRALYGSTPPPASPPSATPVIPMWKEGEAA